MNKKQNIKAIGISILLTGLASIVDRICYLDFLKKNGYQPKDIIAPINLIIEYHLNFPGNLLAALMILPVACLCIAWAINSMKEKKR